MSSAAALALLLLQNVTYTNSKYVVPRDVGADRQVLGVDHAKPPLCPDMYVLVIPISLINYSRFALFQALHCCVPHGRDGYPFCRLVVVLNAF